MPISLHWSEIAVRLGLTLLAGLLIGFNRQEHGKAAGLRTTTLVGLAACVAMIQVNLLLPLAGRTSDSFVMNDLMRLPLGVLTGVGFIGGGAILRRGDMVTGVTTAATLWLITIIGLCLGGGQLGLGSAATVLGLVVLWGVGRAEAMLSAAHRTRIVVELEAGGISEDEIHRILRDAGLTVATSCLNLESSGNRELKLDVPMSTSDADRRSPSVLTTLAAAPGVRRVVWQCDG
jgi:putative Mg2+ transporter-C (MgtC) family protein